MPTPVRPPGLVDVLEIVPTYVDEVVVRTMRDTHRAWSQRVYGVVNRATGGAAEVPQLVHSGLSEAVFAGLGAGLRAGSAAARVVTHRGPALTGRRGRVWHSALNGLLGDRFATEGSPLTIRMGIRVDGVDVPPEPADLHAAFPSATGRVVVLLHGLGEHEEHWAHRREEVGSTYAETLAARGWTPVLVRYNTGLSLRENGVALSGLLQDLVDRWPAPVHRIALVGHSMGGLVARAAGAVAGESHAPWAALLGDVVTLGTPHLGADLARVVGVGSRALGVAPETAAFGRILDQRSVGIVDLGDGLPELAALPRVRYRLVSASLGRPWGSLVGDLMVRRPSATGRTRRSRLFPDAEVLHLRETGHFGLLNHPAVHGALERWLG